MTVTTEQGCGLLRMLRSFSDFAQDGVCGRCLPCPLATSQAIEILRRLTQGKGQEEDLVRLHRISVWLEETARCRRGQETARVLAESLRNREEYDQHLVERRCPAGSCRELVRYRVVAERCTMCGQCQEVCPRGAIVGDPYVPYLGDNQPYTIRESKCDGCGRCLTVCAAGAIERA